jgi:hypothetical protein
MVSFVAIEEEQSRALTLAKGMTADYLSAPSVAALMEKSEAALNRNEGAVGLPTFADDQVGRPPFLPGKINPSILALEIAEGIRAGARLMIEACVLLDKGMRLCEADAASKDQFLQSLAEVNVIPKRSSRTGEGFEKSKLSMLRKIGEHADLLLDDRLFKFLEPGRSILYHVIRMWQELPGGHDERMARLIEIFESQGSLTRSFLIDQIGLAKRASLPVTQQATEQWTPGAELEDFDLVLASAVSPRDVRRLTDEYADRPPLCICVHERVAKVAVGIFICRLIDLPIVANKLLPGCGFATISRIILPTSPDDSNVTNAQAVVIASRGRRDIEGITELPWLGPDESLEPVSLASRLVPNAKNKLQLFATMQTDGWSSITGDANWGQADE